MATKKARLVRAVRSFRPDPPELEYVVVEGAVLPEDHPAVAHPDHFEPARSGRASR